MAKILLVEDDAVQIELIRKLLEPRGHVVVIARNGLDGIKSAQQEKPGLILMDMIMPGMHGLEATIKLKEDTATSDIPIIALTIMSSPKFVRECYQAGVIGYIKKPYDPKVLLESVERVVGKPEKSMGKILMIARASRLATMIEMRLVRHGYEVKTLDVKKSVLGQLGSETAGAIFVDVSLPEAQVAAVFDELRGAESTQGIPVIVFAPQMSREALDEAATRWGTPFQIASGGELGDVLRRIKESAGD
jgi:CheY-like chemotaxis protein